MPYKVRMEEQDSPPSSLSSRHSHEDDEDKMPEEAFMKYTKDSRAGSPAPPATTSKVQYVPSTSFLMMRTHLSNYFVGMG